MKRIVTVERVRIYEFDDSEYPVDRYSDDEIMDMAFDRWEECETEIFIDREEE